jgi:hypothetical protein
MTIRRTEKKAMFSDSGASSDRAAFVFRPLVRMTEFLYKLCIGLRRESPDREIGAREGEMLQGVPIDWLLLPRACCCSLFFGEKMQLLHAIAFMQRALSQRNRCFRARTPEARSHCKSTRMAVCNSGCRTCFLHSINHKRSFFLLIG